MGARLDGVGVNAEEAGLAQLIREQSLLVPQADNVIVER